MTSHLQQLIALQAIDTQLDQARHRREHLDERAELTALDRQGTEATRELAVAEAAADEVASRQASTEAELANAEGRIAAIDKRLYSGEVTSTKDLQAMSAEADHLRSRASALEDDILGLLDEREPFDAEVKRLRAVLAGLAVTRQESAERLAVAESEVDRVLAHLAADRPVALADVPDDVLATYERLRSRLGGVAVARVVGDHCDGCHLTLSAVELDRVRHLADGEVYNCEQCSRILVP
jgi:hypothetical protein